VPSPLEDSSHFGGSLWTRLAPHNGTRPPNCLDGSYDDAHRQQRHQYLGRLARPRPRRDLGPRRPAQRLRRSVATDSCVQGVSSGGEGVAGYPPGAGGERRIRWLGKAGEQGVVA